MSGLTCFLDKVLKDNLEASASPTNCYLISSSRTWRGSRLFRATDGLSFVLILAS
jgi:hypothetical protein